LLFIAEGRGRMPHIEGESRTADQTIWWLRWAGGWMEEPPEEDEDAERKRLSECIEQVHGRALAALMRMGIALAVVCDGDCATCIVAASCDGDCAMCSRRNQRERERVA